MGDTYWKRWHSVASLLILAIFVPSVAAAPLTFSHKAKEHEIAFMEFSPQSLEVDLDEDFEFERVVDYEIVSEAILRQSEIINNKKHVSGHSVATSGSRRINNPKTGLVFYPLLKWRYSYQENGYMTKKRPQHYGMDFMASQGTEIYSIAAGTVIASGMSGAYGYRVIVAHEIGGYHVESLYAHMVRQPPVKVGDVIDALEILGHVGSTGRSHGPHLHLEIRVNGARQDPASWLALNAMR